MSKITSICLLTMMLFAFYSFTFPLALKGGTLPFAYTSIEEAEKHAKVVDKPLFVNFFATWCSPCKWMEEATFKDVEVQKILKERYVTVNINIDEAEGLRLKAKYEIKFLPTMIIINHDSRVTARIEESVGPGRLLDLLQQTSSSPTLKKLDANLSPKFLMAQMRKDHMLTNKITSSENLPSADSVQSLYRIQLGVFSSYEGAISLIRDLNTKFREPIIIIQEDHEKKTLYKVMLGEYNTTKEASEFKQVLKEKFSLEGFVI